MLRRWIAIAAFVALIAVTVAVSVAWWNGFFWVVAALAVVVIVKPELPERIAAWLDEE